MKNLHSLRLVVTFLVIFEHGNLKRMYTQHKYKIFLHFYLLFSIGNINHTSSLFI